MARIRSFEPSGQDGLQTFRFLISDFSRFQEFLLELGVLLGDLLRHLPPLRFQAPGQGLVLHRQDLGGQHSSIFRAVQCYRSHRDAAGHLDCGQQGIQSIQDYSDLLHAGAEKVSVNSYAVAHPEILAEAARKFGSQCVVLAIDAKWNGRFFEVYTHGGRRPTGMDAVAWAKRAVALGAGEILLTSMDADGTKAGFDLALTRAVARAVPIPVIASGGVGTLEHFAEGVIEGEADAVLAASVFHFGTFSIREVKEYMASQGIPVRLDF